MEPIQEQQLTLTVEPRPNLNVFVLTGLEESPANLNYDILGLHKVRKFVKGELIGVDYYKKFDEVSNAYSGLCVREYNTYIRKDDFVYKREKRIEWLLASGFVGEIKETIKYYSPLEAITEGKIRRQNIINEVKFNAWYLLGPLDGFKIMSVFKQNIDLYIEGVLEPLHTQLAASTEPYLDNLLSDGQTTVRAYLINFVTI
ncbi:hypothetical protein Q0590_25035 [Rhodocytophaga aerolata]|uniref:Uncharacterized protein n=1 Tax=Rhodocytophaga aerolata TaxID=455078 RepID=A0ABT8RBT4_9BACT|nr:hypothetical protein [Rhodocytophaga aerolata]MDO1449566.1 hypothetical protein [Rhodocytophaga aerolata]